MGKKKNRGKAQVSSSQVEKQEVEEQIPQVEEETPTTEESSIPEQKQEVTEEEAKPSIEKEEKPSKEEESQKEESMETSQMQQTNELDSSALGQSNLGESRERTSTMGSEEGRPRSESRAEKLKHLRSQSVEVGSPEHDGETPVRRNVQFPDRVLETIDPKITTLHENLLHACEKYADRKLFGVKKHTGQGIEFDWIKYNEFLEPVKYFGSGLVNIGINKHDKVGIFASNCLEWVITEQVCNAYSFITVPIYETFGKENIPYVIDHAEIRAVVCAHHNLGKLMECRDDYKCLEKIILIGKPAEKEQEEIDSKDLQIFSFNEIVASGKENPHDFAPPKPNDIASIMYTSGTTGQPKGVIHTHKSMTACIAGMIPLFEPILNERHIYISYLPLAHVLERMALTAMIFVGATIIFSDPKSLGQDLRIVRPTIFTAVPRVLEKIRQGIESKTVESSNPIKKIATKLSYQKKKQSLSAENLPFEDAERSTPILNKLIFDSVKEQMGGRLRLILVGGAPLRPESHEFLRTWLGVPIVIGYGLTETACAATISNLDDRRVGHSGPPVPCCEIKLVSDKESGYSSDKNQGEIYIRGPILASGYYKNEEKTREDFKDGWFATGDIGEFTKEGTLRVIDRKKNIFKLSQGEYIAAEKLEQTYEKSKFVSQIFIYGDSSKNQLIAIISVSRSALIQWARNENIHESSLESLCKNKRAVQTVKDDLDRICKEAHLQGFERVGGVILTPEEFNVDNDLATPNDKLKRPKLKEHFQKQIDALYEQIEKRSSMRR